MLVAPCVSAAPGLEDVALLASRLLDNAVASSGEFMRVYGTYSTVCGTCV